MLQDRNETTVSVIIPTYNRAKYVTRAIDSVLAQSYSDYEIIVIDDGSTDDTERTLEPYASKIRYIGVRKNAGPGAARNIGIKAAGGVWVAFLDSDDTWFPCKLKIQLAECIRLNADVCFHDLSFQTNGSKKHVASWNSYINEVTLGQGPLDTNILLDAYERMMIGGHLFLTTTFFVKRDLVLQAKGFREDLRTSEDLELYFRLASKYPVAYVAQVLATYSPASTGRVANKERVYTDRIKAIRMSISDRIQSGDYDRAKLGKIGILLQIRSLAGEYRRSGLLGHSLWEYLYWLAVRLTPVGWITYTQMFDRFR